MVIRYSLQESCFVVKATVKFVIDTDEWWYTACVSNKKVVPDEKMYFCAKCNKHVMHVSPRCVARFSYSFWHMCVYIYFILFYLSRYMIKVRVIDETDSATFVIFDRDAALLLEKNRNWYDWEHGGKLHSFFKYKNISLLFIFLLFNILIICIIFSLYLM